MIQANWIWESKQAKSDEYVKFYNEFSCDKTEGKLSISCDSNYNVFLNGKLVAFGQYADYPYYKVYDELDVTPFLKIGKNKIVVVVWYYGEDSFCYQKGNAGVIFELVCDGKVVCWSSEQTSCLITKDFVCHQNRVITSQMGLGYSYDSRYYDGYDKGNYVPRDFHNAVKVDGITYDLHRSKIKKLLLGKIRKAVLIDRTKRVYDLGRECVGFLCGKMKASNGKTIRIGYGEHLINGEVSCFIGPRDFHVEWISNGEFFEFKCRFRRLGCRYLQILDDCEMEFIGLEETDYPLNVIPRKFDDGVLQKIFDTSVRTLTLCMHEHYEDTPWREQCLYAMDGRNQMLCGYVAFGETEFARANLELMSVVRTDNGLLPLCFPAGLDVPIPFFSLMYIKAMVEYAEYSEDLSLLEEKFENITEIINFFILRQEENGLIPAMKGFWNFYEWSDGMDGISDDKMLRESDKKRYDLPLNCFVIMALNDIEKACKLLGKEFIYTEKKESIRSAIKSFYLESKDVYTTYLNENEGHISKLANSLAILADPTFKGNGEIAEFIMNNKEYPDVTLSMKVFEFDALLEADSKNGEYIVNEIKRDYSYMLSCGATSFWETILGASDFYGAGSLCHGWSAIPVYYLNKLYPNYIIRS